MKKGFTIIEIIISIALIIIICAGSLTTINLIEENNNYTNLSEMSEEILTALNLYIETHEETKKQIYESKNGAIISLQALQNEGLIDFKNLEIEDEYVVTLLSRENDCEPPEYITSWNFPEDKVLYVCTQNTPIIDNDLINKKDYVAKGKNPSNYVKIESSDGEYKKWRIVEIINGNVVLLAYEENMKLETNNYFPIDSGIANEMNNITGLPYVDTKYLKKSYYVSQSNRDFGHDGVDIGSEGTYISLVGLINYSSLFNADATDGNWIYELFKANAPISLGYDFPCGYIARGGLLEIEYSRADLPTNISFFPLITLNDCAELKIDETCSNPGSEECPYVINGSNC